MSKHNPAPEALMQGFPPAPDAQVHLGNWRKPPYNRWAFSHVREIVPSACIPHDPAQVDALAHGTPADLSAFSIDTTSGKMDISRWLDETFTDALLILRHGRIIHEQYFGHMHQRQPHILMSVSKSVLGLVYGVVSAQDGLDLNTTITDIIPEVKPSAYAGATLRNLLDMRVGVEFDENYLAASGKIIEYRKAQGWDPHDRDDPLTDLRAFFSTLTETDGSHDQRFHYVSPNTDLLGWAIERITQTRFADLLSQALWQPMGAGEDGYITVDRFGAPRCAGGICTSTRDLARLGRLFATEGAVGVRQVVPAAWLHDIRTAGDADAWKSGDFYEMYQRAPMHYRNKWYVQHGENPMVFGLGVFGQNVFVEPGNDLVIAKFSSLPRPLDPADIALTHQGVNQLREMLR